MKLNLVFIVVLILTLCPYVFADPTPTPTFVPYPDVEPGAGEPYVRPSEFQPLLIENSETIISIVPTATPMDTPVPFGFDYTDPDSMNTPSNKHYSAELHSRFMHITDGDSGITPTPGALIRQESSGNILVDRMFDSTFTERYYPTGATLHSRFAYFSNPADESQSGFRYYIGDDALIYFQKNKAGLYYTSGLGRFREVHASDTQVEMSVNYGSGADVRRFRITETGHHLIQPVENTHNKIVYWSGPPGNVLTVGDLPAVVPTHTPTNTPVPTSTPTPVFTHTPTNTPVPTNTPTPIDIPATPTPYAVNVYEDETDDPPGHCELEDILGVATAIPSGRLHFIRDETNDRMWQVTAHNNQFFVSPYTPVPKPDYIVSNAGTTAVNGCYYESGTHDGVASYIHESGGHWLYRLDDRGTKYWVIHTDIVSDSATTLYRKDVHPSVTTPYLGTYDLATGSFPPAVVSEP